MKDEKEVENIRVAVRCRPMNERELREQAASCFLCENGNAILTNLDNPSEKHTFAYDHVYGIDSPQEQVFEDIGAPILDRAFGGYNGTIFAYGQTGSGKTFSMSGVSGSEKLEGLIPRMNKAIFERIKAEKIENPNKLFLVECSFFEIYNEIIYDLLDASGNSKKNKGGLEIKEHSVLGIYVKDLQERVVESRNEVIDLMAQGAQARTVGYTQMNAESSRSHSIFIIKIHQKDSTDESKNIFAKINLVDLAGSERAASTGAQGDRLKEGANINKSLSALGNVINALVEASRTGKKVFIPYRNSKLTRVLQESLGGNSLCSMLATLSPANINFAETLSTLKYASRAKSIKVNAKKNEASSQISQLNEEIAALKKKLSEQTESALGLDPKEKEEIVKKYEKQIQEMDRIRLQTWEDKAKLSKQHELERKKLAKEKALADQKIREERTRKWKLLEEKGDIELLMRALRDLDTSASGTLRTSMQEDIAEPIEMQWLATAQKIKGMEAKAKDHRTLIVVFKDSLHKDVELWAKRNSSLQGSSQSTKNLHVHGKRDDSAARHMTASQMCSKLQNIYQESENLLSLENEMICTQNELINNMMSEILRFKAHRKSVLSLKKPDGIDQASPPPKLSREEAQLLEEREKGLSITLSMVRSQRSAILETIKSERKRTFEFSEVVKQFVRHSTSQLTILQENQAPADQELIQKQVTSWEEVKFKITEVARVWEKAWEVYESTDASIEFTGKGDVIPLGLESKSVPDECIASSSRKLDAKQTRLNSAQFWIPDPSDKLPSVTVDFELPRVFHSVVIRGGILAARSLDNVKTSSDTSKSQELSGENAASRSSTSTFVLKPREELQLEFQKYKLDEITGNHDMTYDILSYTMSWVDLLKTNVVPVKLFARPPVRFLHDIISMVILNTGYGDHLYSATQKDYGQLVSKTDRADYLTRILDFVQETYHKKHAADSSGSSVAVIIAATATNILSGKESADTLKFLCYFGLAALEHCISSSQVDPRIPAAAVTNSSVERENGATPHEALPIISLDGHAKDSARNQEESPQPVANAHAPGDASLEGDKENKISPRFCWVKKLRIATSFNGDSWDELGEYAANIDAENIATIVLTKATGFTAGRFIKLTCVEWEMLPLFQFEILGQEAQETDKLTKAIEQLGGKAIALLCHLQRGATLILEEAKAQWDRAKVVEREKQQELSNRLEEIAKLKLEHIEWEKQVNELRNLNTELRSKLEGETKRVVDAAAQNTKLQSELQLMTDEAELARQHGKTLEAKVNDLEHQIKTNVMNSAEQKRSIEALEQTRKDLEELCSNLRVQLQNKEQLDGHQESKIASMYGELMSANVQIDDLKRKLEAAEQVRKEKESFGNQLHEQLQQSRTSFLEKEKQMDDRLKQLHQEATTRTDGLRKELDMTKKSLDEKTAAENLLKSRADQLEKQVKSLQTSIKEWQEKVSQAETATAAAVAAAAEIANASETKQVRPSSPDAQSSAGESTSQANDSLLLEAQTKELRYLAEIERLEGKIQALEMWQKDAESSNEEGKQERDNLHKRINELEEAEEELQLQLQVVTEERDSARQKEEQLFAESIEKDQEIERIRDGYVWVTDRMNSKEDELSEMQEQLERYQSLLQITSPSSAPAGTSKEAAQIKQLYALATGGSGESENTSAMVKYLLEWIENIKSVTPSQSTSTAAPNNERQQPVSSNPQRKSGVEIKELAAIATSGSVTNTNLTPPTPAPPSTTPATTPSPRVPSMSEKRSSEKESDDTEYDDDFDTDDGSNAIGDDGRRARRKANTDERS